MASKSRSQSHYRDNFSEGSLWLCVSWSDHMSTIPESQCFWLFLSFPGFVTGGGGETSYIHLVCNILRKLSSDLDSYSRSEKGVPPFGHKDSVWACFSPPPLSHRDLVACFHPKPQWLARQAQWELRRGRMGMRPWSMVQAAWDGNRALCWPHMGGKLWDSEVWETQLICGLKWRSMERKDWELCLFSKNQFKNYRANHTNQPS